MFQLTRALGNPSPIYGGDEYAYFASGLARTSLAELWQRDPAIQRIVNPLFLAMIDYAARAFPDPAAVVRLVGIVCYITMIGCVGRFVDARAGTKQALAVVILAGLLPSSAYAAAIMPEVTYYAAVIGAVLMLAVSSQRKPALGAIGAGALSAAAFLLKPHAISLVAGIVVGRLAIAALLLIRRQPTRGTIISTVFYLLATYGFLTISSVVLLGTLKLDPRFVLGDFYSGTASSTVSSASAGLLWIARYLAANASGLLLYTFPFVGVMALALLHMLRTGRRDDLDLEFLNLFILTIFVGAATLLMVSMFTYAAGAVTPSEGLRLHGRYYAYLLVLIFAGALSIRDWQAILSQPIFVSRWPWLDGYRLIGGGWLLCGAVFLSIIWRFQMLPWDNPELQAIYRNDISVWNSPVHVRWFAVATPLALALAALVWLTHRSLALSSTVLAVGLAFVMATINTTRFQHFQLASTQYLVEAGRFARDYFPRPEAQKMLVIGLDRYGAMAYVLFGLACRCHVAIVEDGKLLTKDVVPAGVSLIFSVRSQPIGFPTDTLFKAPAGSLHRLPD